MTKTVADYSTDTLLDINIHVRFDSDGPIRLVVLRDSDDAITGYDFHVPDSLFLRKLGKFPSPKRCVPNNGICENRVTDRCVRRTAIFVRSIRLTSGQSGSGARAPPKITCCLIPIEWTKDLRSNLSCENNFSQEWRISPLLLRSLVYLETGSLCPVETFPGLSFSRWY